MHSEDVMSPDSLALALTRMCPSIRLVHALLIDQSSSMKEHAGAVRVKLAEQINALRGSRGREVTAMLIVTYDDAWHLALAPTLILAMPKTVPYEPQQATNLYRAYGQVVDRLLDWYRSTRDQPDAPKLMLTLLCDGENSPYKQLLLENNGGNELLASVMKQRRLSPSDAFGVAVRQIIAREQATARAASRDLLEHGISVEVIGFGIASDAIKDDLLLTKAIGLTVAGNQEGLDRAMASVTDRVRDAMALAHTGNTDNDK